MTSHHLLICGTRGFMPLEDVRKEILKRGKNNLIIIEGCCPHSADECAEIVAREEGIDIKHFPANSGNYLRRNIEMVEECDEVLAWWDGFSYGTCHTVASAVALDIPITIFWLYDKLHREIGGGDSGRQFRRGLHGEKEETIPASFKEGGKMSDGNTN